MHRTRRQVLGALGATGLAGLAATSGAQSTDEPATVRVPQDRATVQAGVESAEEGDVVLVDQGVYTEEVEVETPNLTVRGVDRNAVVFDGEFERSYALEAEADGVAFENMTARHYTDTAFYWRGVTGYRGSYLTAYNNAAYGVYAFRARDGRFEHSYASGHADAGFYVGRSQPAEAVVANVVAEYNGLGYSGTSTGADLTIRDSLWRNNGAGIAPNTLATGDPPQRASAIVRNVVLDNGRTDVPHLSYTYSMSGTGIVLWGGNDNLVADNVVAGHDNFGVAAVESRDEPSGNVVRGNAVSDSGVADLALAAPAGDGNEFRDNGFETSLPADIEAGPEGGSAEAAEVYAAQRDRARSGDYPDGDWRGQPEPAPQPPMPDPSAPPQPAAKDASARE